MTERPFEDRSEAVKELYSELNVIKPSSGTFHLTAHPGMFGLERHLLSADQHVVFLPPLSGHLVSVGNIVYVFLFGWWVALVYLLVCVLMFSTVIGTPYGMITTSVVLHNLP